MVTANLAQDLEDLDGELAGRRDDEGAEPVVFGPLLAVEFLEYGNQEGESLATASLGSAEDVSSLEGQRYGSALDVGQDFEAGGCEA